MISADSYSTEIVAKTNSEAAFKALTTQIGAWWGQQNHPVTKVGDVFTVSWGAPWYQFRVNTYEPDQKVVWECIDANQIIEGLVGVQKEWVGTKMHWVLNPLNEQEIRIKFRHEGLVPDFICYDFCTYTWDQFITQHLKPYLEGR